MIRRVIKMKSYWELKMRLCLFAIVKATRDDSESGPLTWPVNTPTHWGICCFQSESKATSLNVCVCVGGGTRPQWERWLKRKVNALRAFNTNPPPTCGYVAVCWCWPTCPRLQTSSFQIVLSKSDVDETMAAKDICSPVKPWDLHKWFLQIRRYTTMSVRVLENK